MTCDQALPAPLWSGGRLTPEQSTLFEAHNFKLEMTPTRPDIPVYVASLQEKAIHEIGRVAAQAGAKGGIAEPRG